MTGHSQLAVRFTTAGLRCAAARHRYIGGLALLVLLDTRASEAASGCGMHLLLCWLALSRSGFAMEEELLASRLLGEDMKIGTRQSRLYTGVR